MTVCSAWFTSGLYLRLYMVVTYIGFEWKKYFLIIFSLSHLSFWRGVTLEPLLRSWPMICCVDCMRETVWLPTQSLVWCTIREVSPNLPCQPKKCRPSWVRINTLGFDNKHVLTMSPFSSNMLPSISYFCCLQYCPCSIVLLGMMKLLCVHLGKIIILYGVI